MSSIRTGVVVATGTHIVGVGVTVGELRLPVAVGEIVREGVGLMVGVGVKVDAGVVVDEGVAVEVSVT